MDAIAIRDVDFSLLSEPQRPNGYHIFSPHPSCKYLARIHISGPNTFLYLYIQMDEKHIYFLLSILG
jgi:hypothetical protein